MSKHAIVFDKRRVRSAIEDNNYQELLRLFGTDQIDNICCSLLGDSLEINKDRVVKNCGIEDVILRHVLPENYLPLADKLMVDDTFDCRDFTIDEFNVIYSSISSLNSYIEDLLPQEFYNGLNDVTNVEAANRIYVVRAEVSNE